MNARLYDPLLGRFLSTDPYVVNPDYAQDYNRYMYARNNPLIYTDPTGEFWHIIIGAVVGGVVNLVMNWDNIDGFWQGVTAFGMGAGAGAAVAATGGAGAGFWATAGVAAGGGALTSGTNSVIAQTGKNFEGFGNVDWEQVGVSSFIGGVSSFAGSAAGYAAASSSLLVNNISHPLVRSAVVSPLAAGAGHVAGGTTANLIAGQNLGNAFTNSFKGIGGSMLLGGAIGVASTAGVLAASGVNPITLKALNVTQQTTLSYTDKQMGSKFGEHLNTNIDGYRTISEYRQLANDIYNNPLSIKTTYPLNSPIYGGETHYNYNGNLLRLDQSGYFRSLYPFR